MDSSNYEAVTKEFNSVSFKKMLKDKLGQKCVNCCSDESIEYHHVVPRSLGGTNNIWNIVPLCYECHKAAHTGQHMTDVIKMKQTKKRGRQPLKLPDNYISIFDDYVNCAIDAEECRKLLRFKEFSKLTENVTFKAYLKERGIKQHRNNLGIIKKNGNYRIGAKAGYIEYENGTVETKYIGRNRKRRRAANE